MGDFIPEKLARLQAALDKSRRRCPDDNVLSFQVCYMRPCQGSGSHSSVWSRHHDTRGDLFLPLNILHFSTLSIFFKSLQFFSESKHNLHILNQNEKILV